MHINHENRLGYLLEPDVAAIAMCSSLSYILFHIYCWCGCCHSGPAPTPSFFYYSCFAVRMYSIGTAISTDLVVFFFAQLSTFFSSSTLPSMHVCVFWLDDFVFCRWQSRRFGTRTHAPHIGCGERSGRQTKWGQFITFTTLIPDDWAKRIRGNGLKFLRKLMLWFSHFHWADFPDPKSICKCGWLNKDNNNNHRVDYTVCGSDIVVVVNGTVAQFRFNNWLGRNKCRIEGKTS